MPGLDPQLVTHKLIIKEGTRPIKLKELQARSRGADQIRDLEAFGCRLHQGNPNSTWLAISFRSRRKIDRFVAA